MSRRAGICLCLAAESLEADLRHVAAYRDAIDLVELRADHLRAEELAHAGRLPQLVDLPVILAVRREKEGGRFSADDRDRVALLERLAPAGFAYVDLEEDLDAPGLEGRYKAAGSRVIRSLHDLAGVPHDFSRRVAAIARDETEIPKAAVTPRTAEELAVILEAAAALGERDKVVLGMGAVGFPTRVLAPRLGSAWCYASPGEAAVAPGQIDPLTLKEVYRFRSQGPDTAVYGVIGNPVMHSRSPMIHSRGLGALGLDAVYVPFHVPDLEGFWAVADLLRISGLSVTVPHKQSVMERIGESDVLATAAGACNTMVRSEGRGTWRGTNTDIEGFLGPLRACAGPEAPKGLCATVIGAGGAARAIVYALTAGGARVLILNRSAKRGQALAAGFGAAYAGLDASGFRRARNFSDLIVQCTSAGMAPNTREDPAAGLHFTGNEIVYELVYSPGITAFLKRAQDAGCRIIPGRKMLIAQAIAQFQLFTGQAYPESLINALESEFD